MNRKWIFIGGVVAAVLAIPVYIVLDLRFAATDDELAQLLVGDSSRIIRNLAQRETVHRMERKRLSPVELMRLAFGYSTILGRGHLGNCQGLIWVVDTATQRGGVLKDLADHSGLIRRAIDDGDECAVKLLVLHGANFQKPTNPGETPLQRASRFAAVPNSHCPECFARIVEVLRAESDARASPSSTN